MSVRQPLGGSFAAGRAALSCKRKLCPPGSCPGPGVQAFWLLRGPWPAKSKKKRPGFFLFFSLLPLLKSKHSTELNRQALQPGVGRNQKPVPAQQWRSPQGPVCAAGAPLGTQKQCPILVQSQHPYLLLGLSAPKASLQWSGPLPPSIWSC